MPAIGSSGWHESLMLDHVFSDAIGAMRSALEQALLERRAVEERFTTDSLSGDTRWETSYSLPGESQPPRVQADLALLWTTWSQASYRTWYLNGELHAVPEIDVEVTFRSQDLATRPDPADLLAALPDPPKLGRNRFSTVGGPTLETTYDDDCSLLHHALEVQYSAPLELHTGVLEDGNQLDELLGVTGSWIAGSLVALSAP